VKAWQLIGSPDYSVTALQIRIYMGVQLARAYPQGGGASDSGRFSQAKSSASTEKVKLSYQVRSELVKMIL